jgi:xylan 1,4-beta-xylosidase
MRILSLPSKGAIVMGREAGLAVLCLLLSIQAPAQQRVRIQVHAGQVIGPFKSAWAYVGHDEPNYTYSPKGRALLIQLAALSPYAFHDHTHNLLTTGNGSRAPKWGSTNVYTEDASGRPVYNWAILDRIFDTYP